jgi:hypothetical protein
VSSDLFSPVHAFGRDLELGELEQLVMARLPLLIVVGPRAVGKTAVARDLAERMQQREWDVIGPWPPALVLDHLDRLRADITGQAVRSISDAAAGSTSVATRPSARTRPSGYTAARPRLMLVDDYEPTPTIDARLQMARTEGRGSADTFVLLSRHAPATTALGPYRRFDLRPTELDPLAEHLERLGRHIEPVGTTAEARAWAEILVTDVALIPDLVQALSLVRHTGQRAS